MKTIQGFKYSGGYMTRPDADRLRRRDKSDKEIPETETNPKLGGLYDAFREGVAQGLGVEKSDLKSQIDGAARVLSQAEELIHLPSFGGNSAASLCGVKFPKNWTYLYHEVTCPKCADLAKQEEKETL